MRRILFSLTFTVLLIISLENTSAIKIPAPAIAQSESVRRNTPPCLADFDEMVRTTKANYAGYQDKVQGRESELNALTERLRAAASKAADFEVCTEILREWAAFFNDRHYGVTDDRPAEQVASPTPAQPQAPAEDPRRPKFQVLDDQTVYLRIPSFSIRYKEQIDNLIETNRAKITSSPYLILDLRGNQGGFDQAYTELRSFLYTHPIKKTGNEIFASEENIQAQKEWLASKEIPEGSKNFVRSLIERMEANRGKFVVHAKDHEIKLETILPYPQQVALLIDKRVASSAEEFTLEALQNRKTTVLGQNTSGTLDYSNWIPRKLPSGLRRAIVPVTRSHRVPKNPVDPQGIAPQVRIPDNTRYWVAFARGFLVGKSYLDKAK